MSIAHVSTGVCPVVTLTVSNGGSGAVVRVNVQPFLRGGALPRRYVLQLRSNSAVYTTHPVMRTQAMLPYDVIEARGVRAAVQDYNGLWSEWSGNYPHTPSGAYTAGSAQGGFASGAQYETLQEEPGIVFPDLSLGSGTMQTYRTGIAGGLGDEQRRSNWGPRASFLVVLNDLEEAQSLLLHQFYRQLNGGWKPFHFSFRHPVTDVEKRYVVRFQDPTLAEEMFVQSRSRFSFTLVEVVDGQRGEDL